MRINVGALAACVSFAATLVFSASGFAQTPALVGQLVGHWRLVSVDIGGAHPLGANPEGSMFFDAGGNYSVIVIGGGASNGLSYFGTYKADDSVGAVTMHIEAGSRPGAAGRDETRLVTFDGDTLTMKNQTPRHGPSAIILRWQRAN